jgi:ligand-binding sensor domain-containing protein
MRNIFCLMMIAIVLASCEKSSINHKTNGDPNTTFDTKILSGYFVISIAFDSKGNAWIGTFKQGLIKYNSRETTVYNSSNSLIPANAVISDIAIDSKDNVWIGCEGLIKYDGNKFSLYNSKNTIIPEDFVHSIDIDSKDNIWFTSCRFREGGIVKYDGINWEVFTPENSDLPVNLIQSLAIDHNDNVWLALGETVTQTYLVKISGKGWTTYSGDDIGFAPYYLGDIVINSQNEVCASIDYSLSSSFIHSGPKAFVFDGNYSVRLDPGSETMIRSLKVDNEDNIWCNTFNGFAVYNWDKWTINDSIFKDMGSFTIEQAPDKKIWIGTGDGIYINN